MVDRAEPHAPGDAVELVVALRQRDDHLVPGRFARAAGAPAPDVVDRRGHGRRRRVGCEASRFAGDQRAVRVANRHLQPQAPVAVVGCVRQLDVDHQVTALARTRRVGAHAGVHPHGSEPGDAPALDAHRPPDPGGDEARSPVPAEVGGHLAHVVVGLPVGVRTVAVPLASLVGHHRGRGECHLERVRSRPHHRRGVEAVRAVLVLGAAEDDAVERDGGERVESIEHELDPLGGIGRRLVVERHRVGPLERADPLHLVLVTVDEGVGDQPGGEQVDVHAAGHRGGQRRIGGSETAPGLGAEQQAPAVVQRATSSHRR